MNIKKILLIILKGIWFVLSSIFKYALTVLIFACVFGFLAYFSADFLVGEFITYKNSVLEEYDINGFDYRPNLKTEIYTKDGSLIAEVFAENRTYVSYANIPKIIGQALVSVEDHRFYEHHGVDPKGVVRALVTNFTSNNDTSQGASTITQQLTRELFLSQEKTWERKIKEMFIALELEKKYDKTKILEMYLNEVYFGHQAYGIASAAEIYLDKELEELNMAEVTLLVGLPQAPSSYDLFVNPDRAAKRRLGVLDSMVRDELITKDEAKLYAKQPVEPVEKETKEKYSNYKYPHFTNWVVQELEKEYGKKLYTSGLKIYTTITNKNQQLIEKVAKQKSKDLGSNYGINDIAMVSIDHTTGAIVAMAGGSDFSRNQINMATRPRQPGSSIKPIVYATGIDLGIITDGSIELDAPVNFNGYTPKNWNRKHSGYMTLREALRTSNNVVAVKTGEKVGIKNITNMLKSMGVTSITENDVGLGLSIGGFSRGISPLEMAQVYGVFANNGYYSETYFIDKIVNRNGKVIFKHEPKRTQVLQMETTDLITDMLVGSHKYNGSNTDIKRDAAGKTGTTNSSRDMWYVGYTPNITTSVWVGNSDNSKPKDSISSGRSAGAIWKEYMLEYHENIEKKSFNAKYSLKPYTLYISNGNEVMLAGKNCSNNTINSHLPEYSQDYFIKTFMLRPEVAPKETKECEPINEREYIEYLIENDFDRLIEEELLVKLIKLGYSELIFEKNLVNKAIEQGALKDLVKNGYLEKLINLGYYSLLVEEGFKKELEKHGYIVREDDNSTEDEEENIIPEIPNIQTPTPTPEVTIPDLPDMPIEEITPVPEPTEPNEENEEPITPEDDNF